MTESTRPPNPRRANYGTVRRFFLLLRTNWISSLGAAIAFMALLALVTLVVMTFTGRPSGPYDAILTFFILPAAAVLGLLLIPFGLLLYRKRLKSRLEELADKPLYLARAVVILTIINLAGILIVGQQGYHYVSSNQFCGTTCHDIMTPEYVTFLDSVHANIECADCHIGPGVESAIKAKLNGLNQLVSTINDSYHRPIETPVHQLRPAAEICNVCHWQEKYVNSEILVRTRFREDENNTAFTNVALMRIGGTHPNGKATGIHWHTNPRVEVDYVHTDEDRMDIVWVRSRREDGTEKVFTREGIEAATPPDGHMRRMDCTDCHNRNGHHFEDKNDAVDAAMASGLIPRNLPFIKKHALEILEMERTRPAAAEGIRRTLRGRYEENDLLTPTTEPLIERAADALAAIWLRNVYPDRGVLWGTYPSLSTHLGCFRCHDRNRPLTDQAGNEIPTGCDVCHTVLSENQPDPEILDTLGIQGDR